MRKGDWFMYVDSGGVFSLIRVDGFGKGLAGIDGEIVHYVIFTRDNGFAPAAKHAHVNYLTKFVPEATQIDAQVAEDLLTTLQRKLP